MMESDKKYSAQHKEYKKALVDGSSKNILFGKGVVSGTKNEMEVELAVFEATFKNENQHHARIRFFNKGKACADLQGIIYGLFNADTPTTFRHFADPTNGAVDIMKFYKVGNVLEGKVFPEDMSIAAKKVVMERSTSVELKRRIFEEREKHGMSAVIHIDPEQTFVEVPDNTPVDKQQVKSEPSKGPSAT